MRANKDQFIRMLRAIGREDDARDVEQNISRSKRGRIKVGEKEKRIADGILFRSIKEKDRYLELKTLRTVGEVLWFIRQPMFDLPGGTTYKADFLVVWREPRITVEDTKGHRTEAFIRAKKQVEALYPIKIEER